jgi:aquaporin related protein
VIAEFVGTTLFLFFAFGGTQVANIGAGQTADNSTTGAATGFNPATLLYISLSFGFSLMVNAWIFFRISGGLFNPAVGFPHLRRALSDCRKVTLALTLTRDLHPFRALLLLISQISAGCFAAYIVKVIFPSPFNIGTTLAAGTTLAQGVFIEALCTAELVFTIIMLAKEKHRATYIAPVGIGISLFIGELVAVYYTGGSLNPARSFGPDAVAHQFSSNHWIYWVGPFIGTLLAVFFYYVMKILEYEVRTQRHLIHEPKI